jgi:hypothetical protein
MSDNILTDYKQNLMAKGAYDFVVLYDRSKISAFLTEAEANAFKNGLPKYAHAKVYTAKANLTGNSPKCIIVDMLDNTVIGHADNLNDVQFCLGISPFSRLYTLTSE